MALGIFMGERSFFRADFLYPVSADPAAALGCFRDSLAVHGLGFQYFKGNDTLLHYTLVDWSSGVRKMIDLYDASRSMWRSGKRTEEWLAASFLGDFDLSRPRIGQSVPGESDVLEMEEVNLRLVYNGQAFLEAETYSLVLTCVATGILTGAPSDAVRNNAGILVHGLLSAWGSTAPLFGSVTIGVRPVVEVPTSASRARLPQQAWMVMVSPRSGISCAREVADERGRLVSRSLPDGSTIIENIGKRPAEVSWT